MLGGVTHAPPLSGTSPFFVTNTSILVVFFSCSSPCTPALLQLRQLELAAIKIFIVVCTESKVKLSCTVSQMILCTY